MNYPTQHQTENAIIRKKRKSKIIITNLVSFGEKLHDVRKLYEDVSPDRADNEKNNKQSLRGNTKNYGGKTRYTDS
jgi:hypothetical protein